MAKELILIIDTALAGSVLPLQAVINGRLSASLSEPLGAAFVSFTIGSIVLFAIAVFGGIAGVIQAPVFSNAFQSPWWI